ncbi:hypothetical protein LSH36_731g00018 [Paralvinella palmiformis]|uniref:DUF7042 domain-containing protein n=1 Tax=Paralvinella palmiformis TaxID=53620 RepID=A0AAD9J2I7_9ANNE|nr:hypothetical protein LSH36_731g00018 [Paralvinella palmiformis]
MRRSDCPFHGRLETSVDMADVTSCTSRVLNGCNGSHVMQIHSECVSEQTHNVKLECLSDWNQEGKHYVIAREIVPHGSLEDENRLANCFAFAYEGANLRIETDSECNQGAEHITGKAIKLLVDGHTNPCQKPEQEEESSPRSSKAPYPYPDSHLAHPFVPASEHVAYLEQGNHVTQIDQSSFCCGRHYLPYLLALPPPFWVASIDRIRKKS